MKNLKFEIKWAIIFILSTLGWMVVEKSLGWHDEKIADHGTLTNIFAIVAITVYVLAFRDKKANFFHGQMSYMQGFIFGLIMTLFIALISPFSQYFISEVITPEYFPNVIRYAVESGKMTQEAAEAYFNLKSYMIQAAIGAAMMGAVTSAVVAFFFKSKN